MTEKRSPRSMIPDAAAAAGEARRRTRTEIKAGRTDLLEARNELLQLRLEEKKRQLVRVDKIVPAYIEYISQCKKRLLGITDKVRSRLPDWSEEQVQTFDELLHEALADLDASRVLEWLPKKPRARVTKRRKEK